MERFVNTDKPLSSLTGIRQIITRGDNDTNIKYQSKTKLEALNNLLFDRQQTINQIREIEKDIYHNIIAKLKKFLSNKFSLTEQQYLLLIDKFQLKKNELSREKIKEMIIYLNFQKKYEEKPVNILSKSKYSIEQNNIPTNYVDTIHHKPSLISRNKIIPPEFEPEIEYLDNKNSKLSLEDKLKIMQMERDKLNPAIVPKTKPNDIQGPVHTNFNLSNPNVKYNNIGYSEHEIFQNEIKMHNKSNMQINKDQNMQYNANEHINSEEQLNISNFDISDTKSDRNTTVYDKPNHKYNYNLKNQEYNNNISLDSHSDILKYDIEDERPKLVITEDINRDNTRTIKNIEQNDINLKIQDSLKQIADNLSKNNVNDEVSVIQETKSMNLMANIISTKSAINSTSENLEFNINYNGKRSIENVISIELVSCFINHNFYDKNSFSKIPYLLIKIKEFEDILYLNGTTIGGFCQIIWERKPNDCYTYINSDKLFGIYNPDSPIKLDKLTIELFNHRGEPINIKSTDKDQFNLVFKIKQNI